MRRILGQYHIFKQSFWLDLREKAIKENLIILFEQVLKKMRI